MNPRHRKVRIASRSISTSHRAGVDDRDILTMSIRVLRPRNLTALVRWADRRRRWPTNCRWCHVSAPGGAAKLGCLPVNRVGNYVAQVLFTGGDVQGAVPIALASDSGVPPSSTVVNMVLEIVSLIWLLALVVMIYIFFITTWYDIAHAQHHPHRDAIHASCWLSLFTLHAIWPIIFMRLMHLSQKNCPSRRTTRAPSVSWHENGTGRIEAKSTEPSVTSLPATGSLATPRASDAVSAQALRTTSMVETMILSWVILWLVFNSSN